MHSLKLCSQGLTGGEVDVTHVLRHSCAMHLLQATRDIRKAEVWLDHAALQSKEIYLHAVPTKKLEMLDALAPLGIKPRKF